MAGKLRVENTIMRMGTEKIIAAGILGLMLFGLVVTSRAADGPVKVIFDTDIMGDVDDVGAVAMLHALANRAEVEILAMGVCAKGEDSARCLDVLNTYFGRPEIVIGVNKGVGFLRDSRYTRQLVEEFPHRLKSSDDAPSAAQLYRKVLAEQADGSVVMISVGQLSNLSALLKTKGDEVSVLNGRDLVKKKIRLWVCMGGKFPQGKEANIRNDAAAAVDAVKRWPTPVVFSGFEIGVKIPTGGKIKNLPKSSPVRRAYQLFNGLKTRQSWDQTAVLYGVRGLDGALQKMWDTERGECTINSDGSNQWQPDPQGRHVILKEKMRPPKVVKVIDELMMELPK
ncbi:MAG: nucleoside hydrolase [Verrucomicrobiota bacterium]